MARVRFTENYDYRPKPRLLIAYRAEREYTVKRECAAAAIAEGKAVEVGVPARMFEPLPEPLPEPTDRPGHRKARVRNDDRG